MIQLFLLLATAMARNMPLQLEIGNILIENLQPNKQLTQIITFDQPFTSLPQIALSLQTLSNHSSHTFFAKIQNVTTQGFTIGVLSATEATLNYSYLAVIDDRIQINCFNFRIKPNFFLAFKKSYHKPPRAATFLTGFRKGDQQFHIKQDVMQEGILYSFDNTTTEIVGLCTISGTADAISYTDNDVPLLKGQYNMQIGIQAQTSFMIDTQDEFALYFSKQLDISNGNKKQQEQQELKQEQKLEQQQQQEQLKQQEQQQEKQEQQYIHDMGFEEQIHQPYDQQSQNLTKLEPISQSSFYLSPALQPSTLKSEIETLNSIVIENGSQVIEKSVEEPKETDFMKDLNIKIQNFQNTENQKSKKQLKPKQRVNKGESKRKQQKQFVQKQKVEKETISQEPFNLQNEFSKIKQISSNQTKRINFEKVDDYDPHQLTRFNQDNNENQTKAEQLVDLKTFERAPKLSESFERIIEEAKRGYKQKYEQKESQEQLQPQKMNSLQEQQQPETFNNENVFMPQNQVLLNQKELQSTLYQQYQQQPQTQQQSSPQIEQQFQQFQQQQQQSQDQIKQQELPKSRAQQQKDQFLSKLELQFKLLEEQVASPTETNSIDMTERKPKTEEKKQEKKQEKVNIQKPKEQQQINQPQETKQTQSFLQMSNNNNLRSGKSLERSSLDILNNFSEQYDEERFSRIHSYVEKASQSDTTNLNFLQKSYIEKEEIVKEEQTILPQVTIPSYAEQLKQRKNEILEELKEKYKIRKSSAIQESELSVSADIYPKILQDQYLDEIKRTTTQLPQIPQKTPVDNAYQLEAAFVEWTLHNEK